MNFSFNEEQKLLRESIREFLIKECNSVLAKKMEEDERGYPQELWRKMANLGWMGLLFPKKYGGKGGDFLDLVIMMEEMGRACLPGPFFSSVVLGGLTLLETGNESQLIEFLPQISSGNKIFTLALHETGTTKYDPCLITVNATAKRNGYVINGTKLFVPFVHTADYIICVTRTNGDVMSKRGITLFLIDAKSPGIKHTLLKTIAKDKQFEVILSKVKVPNKNILGRLDRDGSP